MGLENHRTQHRRKRQGDDAGENNRGGHGNAELAIEGAHRSSHERHRNKDRRHHERNGDDGPADFVNHLLGREIGREVLVMHLGMHRFHHHDRIVHDHADR